MTYCRHCGTEYYEADLFCNKCGTKLGTELRTEVKVKVEESVKASNTLIWWVAFLPLVGLTIENICALVLQVPIMNLWWITLILNIVLCWIDEAKIRKTNPEIHIMKAWIYLVPVYLYKRAKALNQNISYFIVWVIMFLIISFLPQSIILDNPTFNFGLGSYATISTVKDGTFWNYPEMTVGEAVDNYLLSENWSSFTTNFGQKVVQVSGVSPKDTNGKSYKIISLSALNSKPRYIGE